MVSLTIAREPQVISREDTTDLNLTFSLCIPAGQYIYTESNQTVIDRIFLVVPYKLFGCSHDRYNVTVAMIDTVERTPHTSSFLSVRADPSGFSP